MDRKTMKKLQEIGRKASYDAKRRGMIEERPFAKQIEDIRELRQGAKTLAEKKQCENMLRQAETDVRVQNTLNRVSTSVNENYNKVVAERTEKMIQKAIASGELKKPDKDYEKFMKKAHRK